MASFTHNYPTRAVDPAPVLLRLVMYPGEVYRLPETGQRVRVASGQAWLTYRSKDVVLGAAEAVCLPVGPEAALLSAVGAAPLVVEVLD